MKVLIVNGSSHFFSAESVKPNLFAFKPGASIAVARCGGTTASFDVLNKYFGIS